jgi:hypothetical protein
VERDWAEGKKKSRKNSFRSAFSGVKNSELITTLETQNPSDLGKFYEEP